MCNVITCNLIACNVITIGNPIFTAPIHLREYHKNWTGGTGEVLCIPFAYPLAPPPPLSFRLSVSFLETIINYTLKGLYPTNKTQVFNEISMMENWIIFHVIDSWTLFVLYSQYIYCSQSWRFLLCTARVKNTENSLKIPVVISHVVHVAK